MDNPIVKWSYLFKLNRFLCQDEKTSHFAKTSLDSRQFTTLGLQRKERFPENSKEMPKEKNQEPLPPTFRDYLPWPPESGLPGITAGNS
jgi:hypothetical protein